MKKNILNNFLLNTFFICCLYSSCGILKHKPNSVEEIKPISYKKLIKNINNNNFKFDWLKMKGNVSIGFRGENQNIKGNFRIRNDSIIWVNFSKSSVQILTGLIGKDSIKSLIKYPEKKYFSGTFNELEKMIGAKLSYNLIENLFTGKFIELKNNKKTNVKIKNGKYYFNLENKDGYNNYNSEYWISPKLFKCDSISLYTKNNESNINISYSEWHNMNSQYFPMKVNFNFTSNSDTITLELKFKEPLKINEKQRFPFKVTEKYTPFNFK